MQVKDRFTGKTHKVFCVAPIGRLQSAETSVPLWVIHAIENGLIVSPMPTYSTANSPYRHEGFGLSDSPYFNPATPALYGKVLTYSHLPIGWWLIKSAEDDRSKMVLLVPNLESQYTWIDGPDQGPSGFSHPGNGWMDMWLASRKRMLNLDLMTTFYYTIKNWTPPFNESLMGIPESVERYSQTAHAQLLGDSELIELHQRLINMPSLPEYMDPLLTGFKECLSRHIQEETSSKTVDITEEACSPTAFEGGTNIPSTGNYAMAKELDRRLRDLLPDTSALADNTVLLEAYRTTYEGGQLNHEWLLNQLLELQGLKGDDEGATDKAAAIMAQLQTYLQSAVKTLNPELPNDEMVVLYLYQTAHMRYTAMTGERWQPDNFQRRLLRLRKELSPMEYLERFVSPYCRSPQAQGPTTPMLHRAYTEVKNNSRGYFECDQLSTLLVDLLLHMRRSLHSNS